MIVTRGCSLTIFLLAMKIIPSTSFIISTMGKTNSRTGRVLSQFRQASDNNMYNNTGLEPFPKASDPFYMSTGPVGKGRFIISRIGEPRLEELANENILKILLPISGKQQQDKATDVCTDLEVNTLVWKCLGYRFMKETWNNDQCFPKWREAYPTPPDLIGMQRIYSKDVDGPSLRANQALVRSIPVHARQSLKKHLRPLGFTGYMVSELTPNKTRRAQCANWLLYYREELFGKTLEELVESRQRERQHLQHQTRDSDDTAWKPPVKQVF